MTEIFSALKARLDAAESQEDLLKFEASYRIEEINTLQEETYLQAEQIDGLKGEIKRMAEYMYQMEETRLMADQENADLKLKLAHSMRETAAAKQEKVELEASLLEHEALNQRR